MRVLQHLHPAIIHFPIVLFLLTATARIFSKTIPAALIQLGLLLSIATGFLAIGTGLLAASPLIWSAAPPVLRWHIAFAVSWWLMACYLYFDFDRDTLPSLLLWLAATLAILGAGTLGGTMVHGFPV